MPSQSNVLESLAAATLPPHRRGITRGSIVASIPQKHKLDPVMEFEMQIPNQSTIKQVPLDLTHSLLYSSPSLLRDSNTAHTSLSHHKDAEVAPELSMPLAITDIVFVCSLDNVPPGYDVVS